MSNPAEKQFIPWPQALRDILRGRVALVGVGNTLRGDDGVGPLLIESLSRLVPAGDVVLFNCQMCPENYIGPICGCPPDIILLVDYAG